MAQAVVQRGVDAEQLRGLLEGASAEQVQAAVSALERLQAEQESKRKTSIEKQTLSVQYRCEGEKQRCRVQIEASSGGRQPHQFEGQGSGSREASGAAAQPITPRIPDSVYRETSRFCVRPLSEDRGQLVFLDDRFCPLFAVCLPFKGAPAWGRGRWS